MDAIVARILGMYRRFGKESLDLHELFEAGGNDPDERREVFYIVEQLVQEGMLKEMGNDFYALTEKGAEAAASIPEAPEPEEGEVGYL